MRGRPPLGRLTRIRSRTGINCGLSPHWPGVISSASGRHPPSPARWILQVRPPRERPSPSSGRCCRGVDLFSGLAAFSTGLRPRAGEPARGRVDADHAPVHSAVDIGVSLDRLDRLDRLEDPVPSPVRGPAPMPLVDGLPTAETLRQVTPRQPGADPEQDPVDHLPVVAPPSAPGTGLRQMRFKPYPLVIRQITPPHGQNNDPTARRSHDPPDRTWPPTGPHRREPR